MNSKMADDKKQWKATQICEDIEHYQVKLKDEARLNRFDRKEGSSISISDILLLVLSGFSAICLVLFISDFIGGNRELKQVNPYSPSPYVDSLPIAP